MNIIRGIKLSKLILNHRSFSLAVKYTANGPANKVYKLEKVEPLIGKLAESEVLLKFIAAPINPSDINLAEGVYGTKVQLPAIGGNEGVAVITEIGSAVKTLKVGDWVVPAKAPFGTWCQESKVVENAVLKIPNDIPASYAATLTVNPCTAYRMLRDFEQLNPGDVIIQNGANSMVGHAIIQMAKLMGVKTVNIVRADRPQIENVLKILTNLGGDINIPDSFLNNASFNEIMKDLPPCKLAFNCIGGEVVTNMARVLAPNGTIVTYGGMSKEPVTIPYELLAYKNLKLKGFWISKWYETHSTETKTKMLEEIATSIRNKELKFFFKIHDLDDFDYALEKAIEPFQSRKIILNLDFPDRMAMHDELKDVAYQHFEIPI